MRWYTVLPSHHRNIPRLRRLFNQLIFEFYIVLLHCFYLLLRSLIYATDLSRVYRGLESDVYDQLQPKWGGGKEALLGQLIQITEKYLGSKNEDYPRKNWSSVIVWNCYTHPNRKLTPEFIENATGAQLHRFTWIDDERIGELPKEWNWLPDEYGPNPDAKLLHYTLGTPCFTEFATTPQGDEWHRERIFTEYCQQRDIK